MPSTAFRQHVNGLGGTKRALDDFPPISTPFVTSLASGLPPGRPISCYTYGVPCVASPDLVAYCRGLVISTVHNYDIVPTLSLGVLRDFKSMAVGFYAEQGLCEEIVGRVIGLYRGTTPTPGASSANQQTPGHFPSSPDSETHYHKLDSATDPADESRDVALSTDELLAGRGTNKAVEPAYRDPNLLGSDLIASDVELSNWLWSLRTTIRASSDTEKLYPPGESPSIEREPQSDRRFVELTPLRNRDGLRRGELRCLHRRRLEQQFASSAGRAPRAASRDRRCRASLLGASVQPDE